MKNVPLFAFLIFFLFACGGKTGDTSQTNTPTTKEQPVIAAVNYPLAYFAAQLTGGQAEVFLPDLKGDPAFWKLKAANILKFQNADLILLNGAGYAKWTENASLPMSKMVNTTRDISDQYIVLEEVSHSHGPEGEHSHGSRAFTTWLDFGMAAHQATKVKDALEKVLDDEAGLDSRLTELVGKLNALDHRMKELGEALQGQTVYGSHPVYQYLARAYGIDMVSMHWEPGEMPDGHDWSHFAADFKKKPSKVMLWEGQPIDKIAKNLKNYGMQVVVFDPCDNQPDQGDFMEIMNKNVENFEQIKPQNQGI